MSSTAADMVPSTDLFDGPMDSLYPAHILRTLNFPLHFWANMDAHAAAKILKLCISDLLRACAVIGPLGYAPLGWRDPSVNNAYLVTTVLWALAAVANSLSLDEYPLEDRCKVQVLLGVTGSTFPFSIPAAFWSSPEEFLQAGHTLTRLHHRLRDGTTANAETLWHGAFTVFEATEVVRRDITTAGGYAGSLPLDMRPNSIVDLSARAFDDDVFLKGVAFRYTGWSMKAIINNNVEANGPHGLPTTAGAADVRTKPHFYFVDVTSNSVPPSGDLRDYQIHRQHQLGVYMYNRIERLFPDVFQY